jgi:hypothetical protein
MNLPTRAPTNAKDSAGWQLGLFDFLVVSAATPPLLALVWMNYRDVTQRLDVMNNMIWYFQRWPIVFLSAYIVALAVQNRGIRLVAIFTCAAATIGTVVNLCLVIYQLNRI